LFYDEGGGFMQFADGQSRTVFSSGVVSAAMGDLNHDGLDDAVGYQVRDMAAQGDLSAVSQFGRAIPFFPPGNQVSAGKGRVAVGDVNNDGFDEVVLGLAGIVTVYSRQGTVIDFPSTSFPEDADLAVGDINGDGFADVVIGSPIGGVVVFSHPAAPNLFLEFLRNFAPMTI